MSTPVSRSTSPTEQTRSASPPLATVLIVPVFDPRVIFCRAAEADSPQDLIDSSKANSRDLEQKIQELFAQIKKLQTENQQLRNENQRLKGPLLSNATIGQSHNQHLVEQHGYFKRLARSQSF